MNIVWGPLTHEDSPAWADLDAAMSGGSALSVGGGHSAQEVATWLANPLLDLETATFAARDGDRLVAVASVPARQSADAAHLIALGPGGVHPDYAAGVSAGACSTGSWPPPPSCMLATTPACPWSCTSPSPRPMPG